ncbi:MAG: hypothetical protein MJ248_00490 [Bacilli bacterium]|nr:hypothetical protein [Bacilli bacterium]
MKRLLTKTLCLQAILFMGIAFSTSCASSSPTNSSSKEEPIVINSTKSALSYINTNKNYTFTYVGNSLVAHEYTFTENAIGITSSKTELNHYYYSDEQGTFEVERDLDNTKYITSEYRSEENVWDSKLTFTYFDIGTSFVNGIKDSETVVRIKNNDYKRTFIQMIGRSPNDFMDIDSLTAEYKAETGYINFICTIGSKEYKYVASDFGTSKINELEGKTLHAYVPSNIVVSARDAMKANNYVQGIYSFSESGNGYVGNYLFNPHYFAQTYNSSTTMTGYVSLHCDAVTDGDDPHPALNGCYYTIIENYATNPTPSINSNPISTNNNIVEVMNYPNNLAIWSNFHKTIGWNGTSTEEILGKGYYTDDASIVSDFSSNFNMDGSFQGQKPHSLGVDIKVSSGQVENITFYYYFMYGATKMCYPIPFYNFGKANVKVLDMIYNTYHTIQD